jgi:hypothetical protein
MTSAIHPAPARTSLFSRIARQGAALAVAGLCWAASTAQAVGVSVAHGTGYPDSTASVSFELDFDQGAPAFDFYLQLDPQTLPVQLNFRSGWATWNDLPLNDAAVPFALSDASGTWGPDYAAGLALSAEPLTGLLRLTYAYDLAGLSVGQSAVIGLSFEYFDSDVGDFVTLTPTASVTAVPEADAALLALAGLGVAGGMLARRRTRERTVHPTPRGTPALA